MQHMQLALARSRGYALLADVAVYGLRPDSLLPLRAVADLAPLLPDALEADAIDRAAADHYATFGLNLFAFESIFLDPESLLNGPSASRVQATCAAAGFRPAAGLEVDALANELACLAFLCGAEADAWEDHNDAAAARARHLQRDFLQRHLLVWLPPLCEALGRQETPFYAALGPLLADLCFDHYAELAPAAVVPTQTSEAPELPLKAEVLDDVGIRAISRRLLAPAVCGIFLGRNDLVRLARAADLPTTFGERSQMLTDLFHAAGRFDNLHSLLNALDQLAAQAEAHHVALEEAYPVAAPFVASWLQKLDATRTLLVTMRNMASVPID